MRFLCLHGRGTNAAVGVDLHRMMRPGKHNFADIKAKIFEDQTAKLREVIGQDNEFVFIEGHVAADAVPGIGSITASQESDRFAFVPLGAKPDIYRNFFLELYDFIETQGPFDALMGFSEGASIVMTIMAEDARRPFAHLRCAILFCTLKALDPEVFYSQPTLLQFLSRKDQDKSLIQVPTAHIWSLNDDVAGRTPWDMAEMCDEKTREVLIHNLGHDVPGSRSDESLVAALRIIERTIERARDM